MATKTEKTDGKTTYLVERGNEKFKITVPSAWKVTFGPIVPSLKQRGNQYGGYEAPNCLRFYEANDRQRAIFTGVTGFRDTSIPVEKLVHKVDTNNKTHKSSKGESSSSEVRRDEEWIPF